MKRQRAASGAKHEQILCAILGSTIARSVLFTELGELPLSSNWLLRTVTFWTNMAALPDNNLFKTVALDNCRDAVSYKVKNWAWSFHLQLNKLGYEATLGYESFSSRDQMSILFFYCGIKWQYLFEDSASASE